MADAPDTLWLAPVTVGARMLGALLWRYAPHSEAEPFVWPAVRTLAEQTGQDARVVRRQLMELRCADLITETFRRVGGRNMRGWLLRRTPASQQADTGVRTPASAQADTGVRVPGHGRPVGRTPASSESPLNPHESPLKPHMPTFPGSSNPRNVQRPRMGRGVVGLVEEANRPKSPAEFLQRQDQAWASAFQGLPMTAGPGLPSLMGTLAMIWGHYDARGWDPWPEPARGKVEEWVRKANTTALNDAAATGRAAKAGVAIVTPSAKDAKPKRKDVCGHVIDPPPGYGWNDLDERNLAAGLHWAGEFWQARDDAPRGEA